MPAPPIAILESGLVCGVGLSAPAACAAIRCAIDNFQETRFMDRGGEWVIGSTAPLDQPWRGRTRLVKMLAMAVRECLDTAGISDATAVPLLLCVAERDRPGRIEGLEDALFAELQAELGVQFHEQSSVIPRGRVSAAVALLQARKLIHEVQIPQVLIAATDSLLVGPTIAAFEEQDRVLTSKNTNGFIPGEAAAAVLVGAPAPKAGQLLCSGLGFAVEAATVSGEEPLRAEGLTSAIKAALADARCEMGDLDFRITDSSGEQYYFKEATLAVARTLRQRKANFYIWHPADCIGEVGAAIGPAILATALAGSRKSYTYGPNMLAHTGNDAGQRAATILRYQAEGAS
jgi:3-oxoacyl-[acyl-carrier-protein] synthase I